MRQDVYLGLIEDEPDPDTRRAVAKIVQKYATASIERDVAAGRFKVTVDRGEWQKHHPEVTQ